MARIRAYAKVNLSLRVFAKRKNESLHRIDSVVVLYKSLFDEIEINSAFKDSVVFIGMKVPKVNTVTRALLLFKKRFSVSDSFEIVVHKSIPLGSGLGGGSSDAAVVLCWLAQQYGISRDLLLPVALQVGSDVPFFTFGYECARVSGFGGIVTPVSCDWKVKGVVTSDVVSMSKDVYEEFDSKIRSFDKKRSIRSFLSGCCEPFNDLQPAFLSLHPSFVNSMEKLIKKNEKIILSGSGSSLAILIRQ